MERLLLSHPLRKCASQVKLYRHRLCLKYKFTEKNLGELKMVIDLHSGVTSFKQRVKEIAEQQWEFFKRGQKKEYEDGLWQRVGDYWREGVGIIDRDGRDRQYRWSAAFVSWVMKKAGAGEQFLYASRHSVYIRDAIGKRKDNDCSAAFKSYRLNEVAPQVGDLVCFSSGEDQGKIDYDTTRDYRAHCDIVVATKSDEIDVIGGNVGESVSKKSYKINSQGYLIDTSRSWFVIIQNLLQPLSETCYVSRVKKSLNEQSTLKNQKEHCSADPEKLATIGRAEGHQIRVRRNEEEYALYTISETRQERPDNILRMSQQGRSRLGTTDEFDAIVEFRVPYAIYKNKDEDANEKADREAKDKSEFIECLNDNGTHTGLIVIAPHGGAIEKYTDQQAEYVATQLKAQDVSCWRCKGWGNQDSGAYDRWHITSTDLHEASFPLLNTIIHRQFTCAVAFHGFSEPQILIGGGADLSLKQEIQMAIRTAIAGSGICVEIAPSSSNYGGDDPQNIVNRLAKGNGIQIEQSKKAREKYWQQITDAVICVYNSKI